MRSIQSPSPFARSVGEGLQKRIVDPCPSYGLMSILPTDRRVAVYQGIVRSLQPKKELTATDIYSAVLDRSLAQYHQVGLVGSVTLALRGNLDNQESIVVRHSTGIAEVTAFDVHPALGYLCGANIIASRQGPAEQHPGLYRINGDYSGGTYSEVANVASLQSRVFRLL